MNFIEKIVYCYEYVFYKEYTCFNCGLPFRMKQTEEMDSINCMPTCSNSCLMSVLSTDIYNLTEEFIKRFGDNWKMEYLKYLKKRPLDHAKKLKIMTESIKTKDID